jgi:hypothetical protein
VAGASGAVSSPAAAAMADRRVAGSHAGEEEGAFFIAEHAGRHHCLPVT